MKGIIKKISVLLFPLLLIPSIITSIFSLGIATNTKGSIVGREGVGSGSQPVAVLYDESKSEKASSISRSGWEEDWVDQFNMNAADPPYVDGDYIDEFLTTYYSDSPLIGYGEVIKEFSDHYGVSVGAFMGQIAKETTFGRAPCGGDYNFGCIMARDDWDLPSKFAVDRDWIDPPSIEAGIESYFNLVRYNYIDKGYIEYKDYLERYSPSFENNQSSFKDLMWGTLKAFGYDTQDSQTKENHSDEGEAIDGKRSGTGGNTSSSRSNRQTASSSNSKLDIDLSKTRLSETTLAWKDEIEAEMKKQEVDLSYLPLLLGILENESRGGGVVDIFQASESRGWSMNDPRMTSELMSIEVGVEHFKKTLEKTLAYGKSVWAIPAGYNFGHAFLDYLNENNLDWTVNVAKDYSATVVAPSLGNTTHQQITYYNAVSTSYNLPFYYRNGGNFHYVPMLMYALGYDLDEIKEIALNGGDSLTGFTYFQSNQIIYEPFTLAGDSLVEPLENKLKEKFYTSYTFSVDLEDASTLRGLEANIIVSVGNTDAVTLESLEHILTKVPYKTIYLVIPSREESSEQSQETKRIFQHVARKYDNVNLIDWQSQAKTKRKEYYDQNELTEKGQKAFIDFIHAKISNSLPTKKKTRYLFNKFEEDKETKKNVGGDLVEIAKSQIGLPYSWGGGGKEGPTTGIYDPSVQDATNIVGFDCSGFMQFIYYQAYGIDIGDWTVPQESSGKKIPHNELEVGDLLFWGEDGSTYHVAMYIGDEQLIESSTPGNPIDIKDIREYDFALRVDVERLKTEQGVK